MHIHILSHIHFAVYGTALERHDIFHEKSLHIYTYTLNTYIHTRTHIHTLLLIHLAVYGTALKRHDIFRANSLHIYIYTLNTYIYTYIHIYIYIYYYIYTLPCMEQHSRDMIFSVQIHYTYTYIP